MGNKTFQFTIIFSLILLAFTACDDNDEYYYVGNDSSWISYGNLEKIDNGTRSGYAIRRDDGNRLIITEGVYFNSDEAKEGLRVFANYSIVGSERDEVNLDGNMNYYIHLYGIDNVLCKEPVKQSFILEDEAARQDSIGNDPINVYEAWFGGKYLNIEFKVPVQAGSSVKHFINLVQDDVEFHNDSVYVTLRHNAYGEKPGSQTGRDESYSWSHGKVSFDLTSIVPEGKSSVPVKLIWTGYGKNSSEIITRDDSGTYTLSGKDSTGGDKGLSKKTGDKTVFTEDRAVCEIR